MTAPRVRLVAMCCGLFVVGPLGVAVLWRQGPGAAVACVALAALVASAVVLVDNRRLGRALRERDAAAAESARLAARASGCDSVTGVANRGGFVAAVEAALTAPHVTSVAVLLVDLDEFSAVNTTVGFAAGDVILKEVAGRIVDAAGPATVGRVDGDMVGILMVHPPATALPVQVADAVHAALR